MPLKHSIAEESLKLNKNVEFEIPHSEITIDKSILEKLPKILILPFFQSTTFLKHSKNLINNI